MTHIQNEILFFLLELEFEEEVALAIWEGRIRRQSSIPYWEQVYGDPRS